MVVLGCGRRLEVVAEVGLGLGWCKERKGRVVVSSLIKQHKSRKRKNGEVNFYFLRVFIKLRSSKGDTSTVSIEATKLKITLFDSTKITAPWIQGMVMHVCLLSVSFLCRQAVRINAPEKLVTILYITPK